jgi:hypothetical protein
MSNNSVPHLGGENLQTRVFVRQKLTFAVVTITLVTHFTLAHISSFINNTGLIVSTRLVTTRIIYNTDTLVLSCDIYVSRWINVKTLLYRIHAVKFQYWMLRISHVETSYSLEISASSIYCHVLLHIIYAVSSVKYNGALFSPGHTALYGLITAKTHQNVIFRETHKILTK